MRLPCHEYPEICQTPSGKLTWLHYLEKHNGSLHNFVFKGWNPNRACFTTRSLRNRLPLDGWSFVPSRFQTIEEVLQILLEIFCILFSRHVVDSGGTVLPREVVNRKRSFHDARKNVVYKSGNTVIGYCSARIRRGHGYFFRPEHCVWGNFILATKLIKIVHDRFHEG